jgi:hypothetical protein
MGYMMSEQSARAAKGRGLLSIYTGIAAIHVSQSGEINKLTYARRFVEESLNGIKNVFPLKVGPAVFYTYAENGRAAFLVKLDLNGDGVLQQQVMAIDEDLLGKKQLILETMSSDGLHYLYSTVLRADKHEEIVRMAVK